MRLLGILVVVMALAGCLEHRASVAPSADPAAPFEPERREGVAVAADPVLPLPAGWSATSAQPIERPVSAWFRAEDGRLFRAETLVVTARPWWQRFPVDLATDLWPRPQVIAQSATLAFAPVPRLDDQQLNAAARDAGFATLGSP